MTAIGEKGKIPRTEWPQILALYGDGATIAEIGRRYGCTAPAIRYIIKRSGLLKGNAALALPPAGAGGERNPKSGRRLARPRDDVPNFAPPAGLPRGDVLGPTLRRRLSGSIASFLVSLDQAIVSGSPKSLMDLVEASDVLMRSVARTRIEIEQRLAAGMASDAADDTFDNDTARMRQQNG